MQDKKPINEQGQRHGLWDILGPFNKLPYKGYTIKNEPYGLKEQKKYIMQDEIEEKANEIFLEIENNPKSLTPYDKKGEEHGFWDLYHGDSKVCCGYYVKKQPLGLWIWNKEFFDLQKNDYYAK